MADFSVGGVAYKSRPFDGAKQIHMMKRLLPAFSALTAVKEEFHALSKHAGEPDYIDRVVKLLQPVTAELSRIPDSDLDFIIESCLDVTERRNEVGGGWAPVRVNGLIMNRSDGVFATRLAIAWQVIGENFADMFSGFQFDLAALMKASG